MSVEILVTNNRSRERDIEDAIIARPDSLGFTQAFAIRNFRVASTSGAVDIVLLPQSGPFRIVLGEAKVSSAPDAGSKVVGQLLMYYAGALTLGLEGIQILNEFARNSQEEAHCLRRTSPQKILRKVLGVRCTNMQAFEHLGKGKRLTPKDVALFVALDNEPRHVLEPLLRTLRDYHRLRIGLVLVREGKIEVRVPVAG